MIWNHININNKKVRLVDLRQLIPRANLNKTLSFGPSDLVRLQNLEKSPAVTDQQHVSCRARPRLSGLVKSYGMSYDELIKRVKQTTIPPVVIRYDPVHDDTDSDNDDDDDDNKSVNDNGHSKNRRRLGFRDVLRQVPNEEVSPQRCSRRVVEAVANFTMTPFVSRSN